MEILTTENAEQTKELAKILAGEIRGGEIICLSGDLGAGKTTFSQGLLEGMGVEGPYTSPTFAILKEYSVSADAFLGGFKIYHIDAYRVEKKDILDLGWKDFAGKEDVVVIVEWAERIKNIIPAGALWMDFKWVNENEREITISQKE